MNVRRLTVVVFGLLLGAIFGEIALRVVSPVPAEDLLPLQYDRAGLERIAAGDTYITFDQQLGWTVAKGLERASNSATYRSNSAGMRANREYGLERPTTGPRLAAFGDSFTHCDDVENDECWTAQLEAAVPGIEVLNFGVSGYAPDQAYLRYQAEGRQYHPCAVLIGFMVENVNRVVNRFRPFYQPETGITLGKPRYLLDGDGLKLLPSPATSALDFRDPAWVERNYGPNDFWYARGMFAGTFLDYSHFFRLARTVAYQKKYEALRSDNDEARDIGWAYAPDSEGLEVASRILIQFARQVEADGATPVVVLFGRKADVVAMRHNEKKVYEPLLQKLNRADVGVIDVTERLFDASRRTGVERLIDKHYRALGNAVVAEGLSRRLQKITTSTCVWP
ncbi:MAG: SGNH/GDSL hydrolase family protein [Chloroflexi bacterium]|nr:SGNH/GDSL hydrolase family protein [Chloroflexota bacterium]